METMQKSNLIEALMRLSEAAGRGGPSVREDFERMFDTYDGLEDSPSTQWLVDAIAHLLSGQRMNWTKIDAERAVFQDLESLLTEIEMYHPASGIQVDDDGICITVRPAGSQLSLVISRTGPQYRIVRAR